MKKICFYYRMFLYGGVEVAILNLSKRIYNKKFRTVEEAVDKLKEKYELHFIYSDDSDPEFIKELEVYGNVERLTDKKLHFDITIWGGLYFEWQKVNEFIASDNYISWIHSIPYVYPNCLLTNESFMKQVDEFVCVSKEVKTQLEKVTGRHGYLIHNELDVEGIIDKAKRYKVKRKAPLELVFVGRISQEKGLLRIPVLLEQLKKAKVKYHLTIVGKAHFPKVLDTCSNALDKYNVTWVGKKTNPYPYIAAADYLILFSDFESWGLVVTEAKILGVPVLISNFSSAFEQVKDNFNGLILNMDTNKVTRQLDDSPKDNLIVTKERIKKLVNNNGKYRENLKKFKFRTENSKWIKLLDSFEKLDGLISVVAKRCYWDLIRGKQVMQYETIKVTKERSEELIQKGLVVKEGMIV